MLIFHRNQELVDMAIDCLGSILSHVDRNETEILVCDNGSTVRSDFWQEHADTYIRFDQNMGISHGWNALLKLSRGEYPVIVGDDIGVRPGWLNAMYEAMQMPDAGMANPHVGNLPYYSGIVENSKWPSGACFMLSQNTINKVGYFNEQLFFPAQFEDTSYWTRLYKAGLKIYTNCAISVTHKEGQTDNAPDIAQHFDKQKQIFLDVFGFDPVPYFYGNKDLQEILPTLTKTDRWDH